MSPIRPRAGDVPWFPMHQWRRMLAIAVLVSAVVIAIALPVAQCHCPTTSPCDLPGPCPNAYIFWRVVLASIGLLIALGLWTSGRQRSPDDDSTRTM
jgi:hypothetical protein